MRLDTDCIGHNALFIYQTSIQRMHYISMRWVHCDSIFNIPEIQVYVLCLPIFITLAFIRLHVDFITIYIYQLCVLLHRYSKEGSIADGFRIVDPLVFLDKNVYAEQFNLNAAIITT